MRGSVSTGAKQDELSTERVWAAGFHHFTVRSRLAGVLLLMSHLFSFVGGRGKPRILNQRIRWHTSIYI
jgi:hypothetical protein